MSNLTNNKFSCEEHIDMAIDDFLVEEERFPSIDKTSNNKCDYCSNRAIYIVGDIE
ncbi:CxxH/CxxC protein [Clostridium hydrogeniformans]|uniref:CxxH/CxxC protein n=1 Tax=Clostridium hydrogeniformans TaxID=349933 RepID=UPI000A473210|nr:CxxH/CxxC protein [Clostridium hydrogeniformans]